jgi:hypothetical protein
MRVLGLATTEAARRVREAEAAVAGHVVRGVAVVSATTR